MKEQILSQLDSAWRLFCCHMEGLGEEEALWAFAPGSLRVRREPDGWQADWPDSEAYAMGPPTIAWVMWHILYWWTTALDRSFGEGGLEGEHPPWPGSVQGAREAVCSLHDRWVEALEGLDEEAFLSQEHAAWPFSGRAFGDVALWLNAELMKNAAEIGFGRFLYAARGGRQ